MPINPILLQEVKRAMASKVAFVASGGGAPPGAPPADPAAAGGAPPMDPAMMGGAPAAPPPSPDAIRALIQEEIKKVNGGGAEGAPKKSKGAGKVDPGQMVEYMERQQKLLINLYESLGLSLPYNILDKPKGGEEGGQEAAPAKEQGTDASASGIPPIKPIESMGGDKQASIAEKAQAARYLLNAMNRKGR